MSQTYLHGAIYTKLQEIEMPRQEMQTRGAKKRNA